MKVFKKGLEVLVALHERDVAVEGYKEISANSTEAAVEKHIPVVSVENGVCNVVVGSVEHPMTEAHYIEWIAVQTNKNLLVKELKSTDAPKASFALLEGEEVVKAYAYCNLHSLWSTK